MIEDKNELQKKISEAKKEAEAAKKKRELKVKAGFAVAYFIAFWVFDGRPQNERELVTMVLISIILAVLHFGINDMVFGHLYEKNNEDQKWIDTLTRKMYEDNTP